LKKQWPYFVLAFVLPVTAVLWWWGLFSTASVEVAERGGYRYAYLEAQGAYSKLEDRQKEVLHTLKQQGIATHAQITVILSDPRSTHYQELRARTGYLIAEGVQIDKPLQVATVSRRQVVVARIKAHPLFAYGKTYSALLHYIEQHDMSLHLPTVEIYDNSVLQVEMPVTTAAAIDDNPGVYP
jgi:effector-binding domain-containing protein